MTYSTPPFFVVAEIGAGRTYLRWLAKRATALRNHDRRLGNHVHDVEFYRKALHTAMLRSGGQDEYTGEAIDWTLAFENRNVAKGAKGRRKFAAAPSVDHVTGGGNFVAICRDETNTSKGCMTANRFHQLCKAVVAKGPTFCLK